MNKLEKAIKRTVEESLVQDDSITAEDIGIDSSINEISRMEEEGLLSNLELEKKKILYQECEQVELVNKFRDIRTALSCDHTNKVVLVTSFAANYGTSFFARNLASVTAFDSSRTSLLIDCNIDRPSVSKVFDLEGRYGVLDYILNKEISMESIIHHSGIKRYRCIPSGSSSSDREEYFTHPRFKSLLTNLKDRYRDRNIFIDAPPILKSADTRILLEVCDQVIIVVPFGKVNQTLLNAAAKIIPKEKYAGIVYNDYIR